jgi:hypothetical protein
MLHKIIRFALSPQKLLLKTWRRVPVGSFKLRLDYDILPRPHYAYCVYQGARLAKSLNIPKISVLEFGVAGGNGLAELERVADEVEREFGVGIEIYGFDNATGLPAPVDYRDLPYVWQPGFYRMDLDALRRRLKRSRLVLGDVADTVMSFVRDYSPAPIAAAFIDLDFYSSTRDALRVFDSPMTHMLPRVFCYFDDVISCEDTFFSDDVGELLAIKEYNEAHPTRQLARIAGFPHSRAIPAQWNDQIYVHHCFDHPAYTTYVHPHEDRQLPLR